MLKELIPTSSLQHCFFLTKPNNLALAVTILCSVLLVDGFYCFFNSVDFYVTEQYSYYYVIFVKFI